MHAKAAGAVDATRTVLTERIAEYRRQATSVTVTGDPTRGTTRTWWEPPSADGAEKAASAEQPDRGHVRLVGVRCAQIGDKNRMVTVVVHEVADPRIEFDEIMGQSQVADALAECAAAPDDSDRRAAAAALSGTKAGASDWTEVYGCLGTAATGAGSSGLDGTIALMRSRSVQVGDHCRQENRIVHTVGPTIGAHSLLTDPDVANALIDIVTKPGDGSAVQGFGRALESGICAELKESSAARQGYATVYRPPTVGRRLQVTDAIGVSIGKRVSAKAEFAQRAHLGPGRSAVLGVSWRWPAVRG